MSAHHDNKHQRGSVLKVDNHPTHFSVVNRNCENYEPAWVCVREGSGHGADCVAQFYSQDDAEEYAQWRNEKGQR